MEKQAVKYLEIIREQVLKEMDISRELTDIEIYEMIDGFIIDISKEAYIGLESKNILRTEVFNSLRKLDILQELVDDNTVTEIMVNGTDAIFVERAGHLYRWDKVFQNKDKLQDVIQQIVARTNRVVNESTPIVDSRLENGARVNVVLPPAAINGPILTIRRFPDKPITMEALLHWNSITKEAADFLKKLVIAGYNIFISGGTGSGKTTFLNALSDFIPKDERIITIEDSAELQIYGIENLVKLETRNANVEGCSAITIRDLIKCALRMRPDRIIIGEVRGIEAIDLIQCLNTGHDGSLSTGHANSAKDMLSRLETMILMGMDIPMNAVRRQLESGIDIIVHLGRLRDKSRKVLEIVEITGFNNGDIITAPLFLFEEASDSTSEKVVGNLNMVGELEGMGKLKTAGIRL
ncbi:pilus assembly protein CpaF [Lachnotalea glycerini]|uniref:CpaF family protein n=1 Tax=Lachnotalea glycerini TaxID=1763509 RepID=A0A255INM1_9FIRM|nr:CpaF family protein [Lachnotalea glycerini]PXV91828.1 pilus assembly protein CpaF [Lachnotalea glycerini]RDY31252.1 CpaF family protein [Lachnotalea glycerini]